LPSEIAAEQSSRSETRLCTAAEGFAERLALFLRGLRDELRMVVDMIEEGGRRPGRGRAHLPARGERG
jgi:hypothetical protein